MLSLIEIQVLDGAFVAAYYLASLEEFINEDRDLVVESSERKKRVTSVP